MKEVRATLTDNNAKLENLEKSIRAANERKRKLVEKNKRITYDILSELYWLEGQELIDAVTAEHELMEMFKKRGMDYNQIYELIKYQNHRPMNTSEG
ncbi:hypothetical protein [uncultured Ruminococcus sp.]|uniref:hypothetical protein n=1 Tax=uncultured Ruminococcus sp. TaxID=165186 RepID=UPI002675BB6B|nr:hypothetical protein [uncultured Ruminococcus sp.]